MGERKKRDIDYFRGIYRAALSALATTKDGLGREILNNPSLAGYFVSDVYFSVPYSCNGNGKFHEKLQITFYHDRSADWDCIVDNPGYEDDSCNLTIFFKAGKNEIEENVEFMYPVENINFSVDDLKKDLGDFLVKINDSDDEELVFILNRKDLE